MVDVLCHDDYTKILQRRFNDPNIKFVSGEVKPISEDVEGFMGEHYQVDITYELNGKQLTEPFFMKTTPTNEQQAKFAKENHVYDKEIFQYETLHKEYKKYGYDTSFAATSYYSIPNQTIVMQNLTKLGYRVSERQKYFDMNHLKCVLKSLALYHAAGFVYERTKSKELKRTFNPEQEWSKYLNEVFLNDTFGELKEFWYATFKSFDPLINLLPQNEEYKREFKKLLNKYDMNESAGRKTNFAKTFTHGDLWSNNNMFYYENDVPVKCCLVDFQIGRYSYPCYDVLLAIYCNTSSEFRTEHLTELYQYYYETLANILQNYGYSLPEIMPMDDFYASMKIIKVNAMLQYLVTISIVYLPKEQLTEHVRNGTVVDAVFKNKVEINAIAFKNNEKFRKCVSDALYDLHDALISYFD